MDKFLVLLMLILPIGCLAQFTISGRVLNQADTKPVGNASVFLSNSSIGCQTSNDGSFTLQNASPGKYDLIISIIGFESYRQSITVNNRNITLPGILIFPKTIHLNEVKIRPKNDPDRAEYYEWFKDEFLGTSALADECKILNPGILDLDYDKTTNTLTASSNDFLEIENEALGYKIKYLLKDFTLINKAESNVKVHYEGWALFEKMKGSPSREKRWQKQRQQDYEGSPMHFFRSVISDGPTSSVVLSQFFRDGFWVLRFARYPNPQRPNDSLIRAKINFYKKLRSNEAGRQDSLSWWRKMDKLPKTIDKLMPAPLQKDEFIKPTDQEGLFALGLTRNIYSLYINYDKYRLNKSHNGRYDLNVQPFNNLSALQNTENSLVSFNTPYAIFDKNGGLVNINSLTFTGVWGRRRMAELLPLDYQPANQPTNATTDNIISKLNNFTTTHIPEKAYLQFDKPYCAAGDTLYFKAYVVSGEEHLPTFLSGVLNVDLINSNNKIDQSIKLHLDSGIAWGDFALPDSLPKGNYRVRAYTQWMKNDGANAYFNQVIPVGSTTNNKITESGKLPITALNAKPDLQFLPEGGNLIAGLTSKIAFKAVDRNGLGIDVKGIVVDNNNKQVCSFASSHLGMGYFYLNPGIDKIYKAMVAYTDGTQNIVDLPQSRANGITLSVTNDSLSKAWVRLQADKAYFLENHGKDFTLIISSGDVNTEITITLDSAVVNLDILKRRLHTGVARFALFSPKGGILCERLLFVQNNDQLKLRVSSDKPEYNKREKVHIKLYANNAFGEPAPGHFSLSVIDEGKVLFDKNTENTILADLLLTSDLRGYVEQPNYYFEDTSATSRASLDVLMLTHGYRTFEWKRLLNNEYPPIVYQPEKGLEITGVAKNALGKPLVNGTVSLISPKGGPFISQNTDGKGNFHFSNLVFTDSAKFILQAVNSKGKNSTTLIYNKEVAEPPVKASSQNASLNQPMAAYLENSIKRHEQAVNYGTAKGIMLKEVKIRQSKKHIIDTNYRSSSLLGPGHADQVMHSKEIEQIGGELATSLNGRFHIIKFIDPNSPGGGIPFWPAVGTMLVIIDGVQEPIGTGVNIINSNSVETVEVFMFGGTSIYGMDGGHGVIIITTKQGGQDPKDIQAVGILPITVNGFYKAREFYAPKYDHVDNNSNQPDLRSTIYWQPELITDKDGNASFEYYNADGTGSYRVVIEGIDEKGNIGRQVYRYKVE